MPIFVTFATPTNGANSGKGRVHSMKQGLKTLTPGNLRFATLSATDLGSGSFAGRRQHEPITITKEVDEASPLYITVLSNNGTLQKLNLNFVKTNSHGKPEPYFTITLTDAAILSVVRKPATSPPSVGRERYDTHELEEIKLTFQKIVYTWAKGGISFSDNWDAPV